MFQVKICGLHRQQDVDAILQSSADAAGLNFYPQSKRFLSDQAVARQLADKLRRGGVQVVGLFVNASADRIRTVCDQVGLDWVQLHGDEPPDLMAELPTAVRVLRAFRGIDRRHIATYLAQASQGRLPDAILLDAVSASYGGSGKTLPWQQLAGLDRHGLPLVLAGGLTADNVARAIGSSRPDAVDVASGVECREGWKDPVSVALFAQRARRALGSAGDGESSLPSEET